jgi:SNF2 family DNA or RNA helicase
MQLDDYQERSRDALLGHSRWGLFDEMGVGKTAPTICAAAATGQQTLVTAPAYLLENWSRELAKWVPGAKVALAFGDREGERARRQEIFETSNADFILTPYHSWHSYPVLQKRKWGNLVFDEAHRLRGRNSQWTRKVFQLQNSDNKNKGARYWFMTGTPLVRDAGDIWPFMHLMDRQLYPSYHNFVDNICHIEFTPWEKIIGDVRDPSAFQEMMARYSIRRLQAQIPQLADLETIDKDIWVDLPPSVLKMMRDAKKEYVISHPDLEEDIFFDAGGALVQRLRMLTTVPPTQANPKMNAFKEFLEDVPNERVGVFTWYRDSAAAAVQVVKSLKRPVHLITGDVRASARNEAVDAYDKDPRAVLVGTISAMKEGLNLQAGRHCVFLEEGELPSDNEQAIGRFKRRGQTRPVMVTRILANKSPDTVTHRNVGKRDVSIRKAMKEFVYSTL